MRYPIGIQTFERLRNDGYLYIDKTEYIYNLTHENGCYFFLSRPRRFGKSLLVSTLHSYFAGKKDLFNGLKIERLEKEWTEYPVLHFDLSMAKHSGKAKLLRHLDFILSTHERDWGIATHPEDAGDRLSNLIETAYKKSGRQVVVLIDEYDAPLLDVVHDEKHLDDLRFIMRDFFSPLKGNEPLLRFVFLTGITKFSQLSIFSELNNISNISMDAPYAAICGITKEELLTQMSEDIDTLASATGETREKTIRELTRYYDGYHFTWPCPDIFNPFSLLNAFAKQKIEPFWFSTGTPTYLLEMMRRFNAMPTEYGRMDAEASDFDAPTEQMTNLTPLLYQSGDLTIKSYDRFSRLYVLDIPNREVEIGMMKSFIPYYIMPDTRVVNVTVAKMARALLDGDMNKMLRLLQNFLATVPYTDNTHYEGHYQQVLCIIFKLLGGWADVEVHTPRGRVDIVMIAFGRLYVIELKLDSSSEKAMEQINLRDYAPAFSQCGLPITKVGVNFNSDTRNIKDWMIE